MSKNKTVQTEDSVEGYLSAIQDQQRSKDCSTIIDLITKSTGYEPKMWGTSIVGFGKYQYKYESGREGSAPLVGIAARANAITLYLSANFDKREELLSQFGKHKAAKGCISIQKLEDIDTRILATMVRNSVRHKKKLYPG